MAQLFAEIVTGCALQRSQTTIVLAVDHYAHVVQAEVIKFISASFRQEKKWLASTTTSGLRRSTSHNGGSDPSDSWPLLGP